MLTKAKFLSGVAVGLFLAVGIANTGLAAPNPCSTTNTPTCCPNLSTYSSSNPPDQTIWSYQFFQNQPFSSALITYNGSLICNYANGAYQIFGNGGGFSKDPKSPTSWARDRASGGVVCKNTDPNLCLFIAS
jgi:hypothetical protein